jgi:polyketide synthase 12
VCTAGPGGALNADGDPVQVSEHSPLRAAGFAVFTVDHRGAPGHGPDFDDRMEMGGRDIDDIIAAADYLAGFPEVDGTRVSLLGTSRGGYTALAALGRAPDRWHRAVLLMGLYDPALLVAGERAQPGSLIPSRLGLEPDQLASYFAAPERRPLASLGNVTSPMLIVHGDADQLVPVEHAHDLAAEAERLGRSAQLITVPGLAHDSQHDGQEWYALWPRIADFLAED